MADSGADGVGGGEMGVNISCIGFHFWNYGSVLEVESSDDGRNSEYSFKMIRKANCTVCISAQAHTGRHMAVEEKENDQRDEEDSQTSITKILVLGLDNKRDLHMQGSVIHTRKCYLHTRGCYTHAGMLLIHTRECYLHTRGNVYITYTNTHTHGNVT